jgi:hypothetical protein
MEGFYSEHGIFLVMDNNLTGTVTTRAKQVESVTKTFESIPGVKVITIPITNGKRNIKKRKKK